MAKKAARRFLWISHNSGAFFASKTTANCEPVHVYNLVTRVDIDAGVASSRLPPASSVASMV